MSEHRKSHSYPTYTMASDYDADYFTVIYSNKIVAYRNNILVFEFESTNLSGAVYITDTLYYTLEYDNRIYCCNDHCNKCIAEIPGYSGVKIWKYISYSNGWIVLEASQDSVNLSHTYSSKRGKTVTIAYDLVNNRILFQLPIPYLIDMGIPEDNIGVLLGEGCEGEEYEECGDGVDEMFLTSIKFDAYTGKVNIQDRLHITSMYDNFDDVIHSKTYSDKNMCFPLFDKYLYYYLETKSLSAHSKYVIYYCKDIKGIIISKYQDGTVYRIFKLPILYTDNMQYYYNEETNIFTIMNNGKVNQYFITLRSLEIIDELNTYYSKSYNDLRHDANFVNLLYSVIYASKCEKISEMKYNYDVALSFAGEDRAYVENVFLLLKTKQVRVFYDNENPSKLWGTDLPAKLDEIYRTDSKFCMVFCSEHYPKKRWTILENKSYKAAQIETERYDYILPVLLDDTEIPGILKTQGYLDARKLSPEEIVDAFVTKLENFDNNKT